jgi:hypothetical protein
MDIRFDFNMRSPRKRESDPRQANRERKIVMRKIGLARIKVRQKRSRWLLLITNRQIDLWRDNLRNNQAKNEKW